MNREELLHSFPSHRQKLVASLVRIVDRADAEELANETLLRALAAVGGFRGDAALGTWLHRIGMNLAYDLLRRRKARSAQPVEDSVEPESFVVDTAAEILERQQTVQCVRRLLAALPSGHRQVLVQADMFDRTAPEIAHDEGITTGNAKIRLNRARRAMKAALENHCEFYRQSAGVLCCVPKAGVP